MAEVNVEPGVLPTSLQALSVKLADGRRILPGSILAELRCLRLLENFPQPLEEMGLPTGVNVQRRKNVDEQW